MNQIAYGLTAFTTGSDDPERISDVLAGAFEHHPFGVMFLDRSGTMVAANSAAVELLGWEALEEGESAPRCCDLLRCGAPDGPPDRRCVTELALEHGGRLPEVRIDLGEDRDTAAWVSAAPSADGVVVSLRQGIAGDRRRRTEPHWVSGPKLRVQTFGATKVSSGETELNGNWLEHRTGKLLKYLIAQRGRATHAEQIVAALWPNSGPEAVGTLRQCVHALRDRLEPKRSKHDGSAFILSRGGGYELDMTRVAADADDFVKCATEGLEAIAERDIRKALPLLGAALEMYVGDFLGDEPYAEWAFAERDHLRDLAGQVLRAISDIHVASGELELAAQHLNRLTQIEPYDVAAQRQLIGVYLGAGRRGQALRRYQRLRQQMHSAFGETLSFDLSDISPQRAGDEGDERVGGGTPRDRSDRRTTSERPRPGTRSGLRDVSPEDIIGPSR